MGNKYKLVNPYIKGEFETKLEAKNSIEAAKMFYNNLSEHFNNNVPHFYFTIQKGGNGKAKFYHFKVTEKKENDKVDFSIKPFEIQNEEKALKGYLDNFEKFKGRYTGGAKKSSRKSSRKSSTKTSSKTKLKKSEFFEHKDIPKNINVPSSPLLKRYNSSTKSSRSDKAKSVLNQFFDKIFIINLEDSKTRLEKVSKEYNKRDIKFDVYKAIDGRCKTLSQCKDKQKTFGQTYGVQYGTTIKNPKERLPASSLTLCHRLIYIEMLKQGWDQVLISEDDVWITKSIEKRFKKAIEELPPDWDMLYLGCGGEAGLKGISKKKTDKNKYLSSLTEHYGEKWYVDVKEDLRVPSKDSKIYSSELSVPENPGGGWNFAVSKQGALKLLKIIGNKVGEHCDAIYRESFMDGKLNVYVLDPPVVYHEGGAFRPDSTIPWKW